MKRPPLNHKRPPVAPTPKAVGQKSLLLRTLKRPQTKQIGFGKHIRPKSEPSKRLKARAPGGNSPDHAPSPRLTLAQKIQKFRTHIAILKKARQSNRHTQQLIVNQNQKTINKLKQDLYTSKKFLDI